MRIHDRVVGAAILVLATPTWMGQAGSVIKGALERLDALLSETRDDGTPMAFNKVAGLVVTGNEDGAHACIAAMAPDGTPPARRWRTSWSTRRGRWRRPRSRSRRTRSPRGSPAPTAA